MYFCNGKDWKRFYGNESITYGKLEDERDGQIYRTVEIGGQTWMAENLSYADSSKYPIMLKRNWCFEKKDSCEKYGRFYTWSAAIDSVKFATNADNPQNCGYGKTCSLPDTIYGICPQGWHLPTNTEWNTLSTEVGQSAKILKSQTVWNGEEGPDYYGFSALPAGASSPTLSLGSGPDRNGTYFWSATENSKIETKGCLFLFYVNSEVSLTDNSKDSRISVRCIKNEE